MLQIHTLGKNVFSGATSFEDDATHKFSGKKEINFLRRSVHYLCNCWRLADAYRYLGTMTG